MFTTFVIVLLATGDRVTFTHNVTFATAKECRAMLPKLDAEAEAVFARTYGKGSRGVQYQFEVKCARIPKPETL